MLSYVVSALSFLGEKVNNNPTRTRALFQCLSLLYEAAATTVPEPPWTRLDDKSPTAAGGAQTIFQTQLAQCCHRYVRATCTALSCLLLVLQHIRGKFSSVFTRHVTKRGICLAVLLQWWVLMLWGSRRDWQTLVKFQKAVKRQTHNFKKLQSAFRVLTRTEKQQKN